MYLCFFQPHNQLIMEETSTTELPKKTYRSYFNRFSRTNDSSSAVIEMRLSDHELFIVHGKRRF